MSSDPNKPGQYPPPQWDSQPQRGAYPVPPHYRVSTSTFRHHCPRTLSTNLSLQRVLLNLVTEVLHQHQARWLHYLLHPSKATQTCDTQCLPMTCTHPTAPRTLEQWDNLTWAIRVSRHRGSERPSRVVIADGARYVDAKCTVLRMMLINADPLLWIRSLR